MSNEQMTDTPVTSHLPSIDPATRVGLLSLSVADLARSLAFYTDAFGLQLLEREGDNATLGAGNVTAAVAHRA